MPEPAGIPMKSFMSDQYQIVFPSLLPKPRVAKQADLARLNTHEPETVRQPGGPATYCYLCCEEWRDHLTKEEEEEEIVSNVR